MASKKSVRSSPRQSPGNNSLGFLQSMIDALEDPVFAKGEDHRWVYFNEAACKMIGKPLEELIGKTDYDLFPKAQADIFWERDDYVLETGNTDVNEEIITWQGKQHIISTKKSLFMEPHSGEKYVVGTIRDITAQRETEERLQRSETLFRDLLDTSSDDIFVFDRDMRCLFVNKAAVKSMSIPKRTLLGMKITELLENIETTSLFAACKRVVETGKSDIVIDTYTFADGKKEWFELNINPTPVGILCISRNITGRMRMEESLKHRIKMESLVADISKHLISLPPYEIDRGIDYALQIAGEFVGVDRSYIFQFSTNRTMMSNTHEWCANGVEPQKNSLQDLSSDIFPWWMEKLNRFETIVIQTLEDLPPEASAEKEILQMQNIQSLVVMPMIYTGTLVGFLGFDWVRSKKHIMDEDIIILKLIGEVLANALKRKQAERKLRAEQEQLISLFNSIEEVIYVTDPHTYEVLFANSHLKQLLRINPVGQKCFRVFQNMDAPCPFCTNSIILKNKYKPYTWEFHNTILNRDYSIIDRIIKWSDGRDVRFELAIDITEQKKLIEQLQQSQKMEAVGRLAGGIAHDFNNMLTAIIGYSEILNMDDRISQRQRGCVEEIRKSATRATSLTQQLLAFSRKQVLQPKIISINSLVADIHTLLKRLIGEHIQLDLILDDNLGLVKVDPGQIEQVIVNLALNSRDAMLNGGILKIETKNVSLSQGIRDYITPGDYVVLSMSDTGSGMDNETIKHIYEPFFTTKEKGKGTGLGLSTVYGIVKQSGGFIEAQSTVNSGTTFDIYLPRDQTPEEEEEKKSRSATPLNGHEKILLVEDDDHVRNLLDTCLKQYGYEVLSAANGGNALQIYEQKREKKFDLLITDVVMPDMNGRALAKRITKKCPTIKALYMSGYTEDAIIHHGVLDEGLHFIQKPFTPHDIARKVREILDAQ